ncbi:MAG TPA: rhodanese-like domain-containing protein [Burkholderiaceae bacterium]|nr:rhodanese-like domain-containing protein [Burkholderiaceae bacterium]
MHMPQSSLQGTAQALACGESIPCPHAMTVLTAAPAAPSCESEVDAIFDLAGTRRIELELPYAGAVTPREAWSLVSRQRAKLVDVRTPAEFKFVGSVPGSVNIEWRGNDILPSAMFVSALRDVARRDQPVLLLCRSAIRSHSAARAAAAAGFTRVYNVLEGFEGQRTIDGRRGEIDGWRRHGLPWTQD